MDERYTRRLDDRSGEEEPCGLTEEEYLALCRPHPEAPLDPRCAVPVVDPEDWDPWAASNEPAPAPKPVRPFFNAPGHIRPTFTSPADPFGAFVITSEPLEEEA